MSGLFADIRSGALPEHVLTTLKKNPDTRILKAISDNTTRALEQYVHGLAAIDRILLLNGSKRFGNPAGLNEQAFRDQAVVLKACANDSDRLREISQLNHLSDEMLQQDLGPLLTIAVSWPPGKTHLAHVLRFNRIERLIERAFHERPHLASFDGQAHASEIKRFKDLDASSFALNRAKLANTYWEALPRHGSSKEKQILAGEFEKKRKHLPIRQLMEEAGSLIQDIKPVFMMSPMSIATYLPPGALTFDLVICQGPALFPSRVTSIPHPFSCVKRF
jgi:hypothetical protein